VTSRAGKSGVSQNPRQFVTSLRQARVAEVFSINSDSLLKLDVLLLGALSVHTVGYAIKVRLEAKKCVVAYLAVGLELELARQVCQEQVGNESARPVAMYGNPNIAAWKRWEAPRRGERSRAR